MIKKIFATTFVIINLLSPNLTPAETDNIKKCVGALHKFADLTKDERPGYHRYVTDKIGVLSKIYPEKVDQKIINHQGNEKDMYYCVKAGINHSEIHTFIMAYHGYLPADPYKPIAQCFAAFSLFSGAMDLQLGKEEAKRIGKILGKTLGEAVGELNILTGKNVSIEQIQTAAQKIYETTITTQQEKNIDPVASLISSCEWYDIPFRNVLDAAGFEFQ